MLILVLLYPNREEFGASLEKPLRLPSDTVLDIMSAVNTTGLGHSAKFEVATTCQLREKCG